MPYLIYEFIDKSKELLTQLKNKYPLLAKLISRTSQLGRIWVCFFKRLIAKFAQTRHIVFWLVVITIIFLSAIVALLFDGKADSAWREMAAGAFSGGIIGAIILWYEQLRETEREKIQLQRDIDQARRLQNEIDNSTNIRSLADKLLYEIIPTYQETISEVSPGDGILVFYGPETGMKILYANSTCLTLVKRIDDSLLTKKWKDFAGPLLTLMADSSHIRNTDPTYKEEYRKSIINMSGRQLDKKKIDGNLKSLQDYVEEKLNNNSKGV